MNWYFCKNKRQILFLIILERELLEIEKLKLQTYKLRKQIDELEGNLIPVSEIKEIINLQ